MQSQPVQAAPASHAVSSSHISLMARPFGAPRFLLDDNAPPPAPAPATAPAPPPASAPAPSPTPAPAPAPSPAPAAPPPADSPVSYRPEGLPDHLVGASERETIDRLFGAYKGARQAIGEGGSVPDKPEGYSFEPSDKLKPYVENFDKDPVYGAVRGIAHKAGITDKQFKAFLPAVLEHFVDGELVAAPVDPKAMLRAMAPDNAGSSDAEKEAAAARRVQDNIAWIDGAKANQTMPEAVAEFFAAAAAGDPKAHAAIEWLRGSRSEPKPAMGGAGAGGISDADLKARIADPRGNPGHMQYDPAFARETDELYKKRYG